MKKTAAISFAIIFSVIGPLGQIPQGQALGVTEEVGSEDLRRESAPRVRSWAKPHNISDKVALSPVTLLRHMEIYTRLGHYDTAESIARDLLEWTEANLSSDDPEIATRLINLGWLCAEQGKSTEAETHYKRALELLELAHGNQHIDISPALIRLAGFYRGTERYREAELLYHRLLSILVRRVDHETASFAATLRDLGDLYRRQGYLESAEPYYEYALAILRNTLGPNHAEVALTAATYTSMKHEQQRGAQNGIFENLLVAVPVENHEQ